MRFVGEWSQAGVACTYRASAIWWAAVPKKDWPLEQERIDELMSHWQKPWGDRRQEIVLIGADMDRAALTQMLDACLLSDTEMAKGETAWAKLKDPFAAWKTIEEVAHEHAP